MQLESLDGSSRLVCSAALAARARAPTRAGGQRLVAEAQGYLSYAE